MGLERATVPQFQALLAILDFRIVGAGCDTQMIEVRDLRV